MLFDAVDGIMLLSEIGADRVVINEYESQIAKRRHPFLDGDFCQI